MEENKEVEKTIEQQIHDKMILKLGSSDLFPEEFLKELEEIDLTKPTIVKATITKSFKKDENSETRD